jgi:hypothetical protein
VILSCCLSSLHAHCQRVDVSAIVHDHGPDVTKGARLSALHSVLCLDHELDLSVNAGIDCGAFAQIFAKASYHVTAIRGSANLYRRLRDEQVVIKRFYYHFIIIIFSVLLLFSLVSICWLIFSFFHCLFSCTYGPGNPFRW